MFFPLFTFESLYFGGDSPLGQGGRGRTYTVQFPVWVEIKAVNHTLKWKKIGLNAVLFSYACGAICRDSKFGQKSKVCVFFFPYIFFSYGE